MAYSPFTHDARNNPCGHDLTPMRVILLKDATLDEVGKHYKINSKIKQEFEDMRPIFYMCSGVFNTNPLLEHYKIFLKEKGITHIAIKDEN